ncbi:MAG: ribonuclease D [Alphaproteobacteria bacterium]|nr:ribonuclease D [Alphaproteobacteria bacterium]
MKERQDIITTTEELKAFCEEISTYPFITVDTEFLREKTYWAQLCLIQVGCSDFAACIDPLSDNLDLEPLFEIFRDENILKVFHAARQDLEIFYRLMNELPAPLFDTQVGAMVCGFEENVSYQNLVGFFTKKNVNKASRVTNWMARPLSKEQVKYALSDVTYLTEVYTKMRQMIEEKGRTHWVDSEMAHLTDISLYTFPPQEAWKRLKLPLLTPRVFHRVQVLATWRENLAQRQDKPRKQILRDEALMEIAGVSPKTTEEFYNLRCRNFMSVKSVLEEGILDALEQANAVAEEELPQMEKKKDLSHARKQMAETLKMLLSVIAVQNEVAHKLLATTTEIECFVCDENGKPPVTDGWRYDVFWSKALDFKEGRLALFFNPKTRQIEFFAHASQKSGNRLSH